MQGGLNDFEQTQPGTERRSSILDDPTVLAKLRTVAASVTGSMLAKVGGPILLALGLAAAPDMAKAQVKDAQTIEEIAIPRLSSSDLANAEDGSGPEKFAIAILNKDQSNPDAFSEYQAVSNEALTEQLTLAMKADQEHWIRHAYKALGEGISPEQFAGLVNWSPDDLDGFYNALEHVANFKLKDFIEAVYLKQSFVPHAYKESVKVIATEDGQIALVFDLESTGLDFDRLTETAMKMGIMEKDFINYLKHGRPLSIPYSILKLKIPPKDVPMSFGILLLILMAAHLIGSRMAISRYGTASTNRDAYVGTVRGAIAEERLAIRPTADFDGELQEPELDQLREYLANEFALDGDDLEMVLRELQRTWHERIGARLEAVDTARIVREIRTDWDAALEALSLRDAGELRWRVSNKLRQQANVVSAALRGFAQRSDHRVAPFNRQLQAFGGHRAQTARLMALQLLAGLGINFVQNPPGNLEEVIEQELRTLEDEQRALVEFEATLRDFQTTMQGEIRNLNSVFNKFHRDGWTREALRFLAFDPKVRPPIHRVLVKFALAMLATGAMSSLPNLLPDDRSFSDAELRAVPSKVEAPVNPSPLEERGEVKQEGSKKDEQPLNPEPAPPSRDRPVGGLDKLDDPWTLAPGTGNAEIKVPDNVDEMVE